MTTINTEDGVQYDTRIIFDPSVRDMICVAETCSQLHSGVAPLAITAPTIVCGGVNSVRKIIYTIPNRQRMLIEKLSILFDNTYELANPMNFTTGDH